MLFENLLNLYGSRKPKEDFLTEVIAYFFHVNLDILKDWLKEFGVVATEDACFEVKTQQKAYGLDDQNSDSRFDLFITINKPQTEIIVEAKVDAKPCDQQLEKYRQILENKPVENKYLILLAKYRHPLAIPHDTGGNVSLLSTTWAILYKLLNEKYDQKPLVKEILQLLRSYNMDSPTMFEPEHFIAINYYQDFCKITEQIFSAGFLDSICNERFPYLIREQSSNTLTKENRLTVRFNAKKDTGNAHSILIGIWLNDERNYPYLRVCQEFNNTKHCNELALARKLTVDSDWSIEHDNYSWSLLAYQQSITSILDEENHVKAAQQFFINGLYELETLWNGCNALSFK